MRRISRDSANDHRHIGCGPRDLTPAQLASLVSIVALGALLLIIGFALVIPRGSTPGSSAARNINMGLQGIHQTPGYQGEGDSRRGTINRVLVGLLFFALGIVCIALATA